MPSFKHVDLRIVSPSYDSPITDLIIELDHLRKRLLYGTTPPGIFFQLKTIFHMLESIASARIEGNQTKVADYIETKIENEPIVDDEMKEIANMERCLSFIDEHVGKSDDPRSIRVDRAFISELHKIVVADLPFIGGEGDQTPGNYRKIAVKISGSDHVTPEPVRVPDYMDELIQFVDENDNTKYDLLKIAIAHHRFSWIHPFSNGNGRTVRMLTYAMLVKYGFNVNKGRILNPAAVFCSNRDDYYKFLSIADQGDDSSILEWCNYVFIGLQEEIAKIDMLLEYDTLKSQILMPSIAFALERELITEREYRVLKVAVNKQHIKSVDLKSIMGQKLSSVERSRLIRRLRDKKMLMPVREGGREYMIFFQNNYLLRPIIQQLTDKDFVTFN